MWGPMGEWLDEDSPIQLSILLCSGGNWLERSEFGLVHNEMPHLNFSTPISTHSGPIMI